MDLSATGQLGPWIQLASMTPTTQVIVTQWDNGSVLNVGNQTSYKFYGELAVVRGY